MVTSMFDEILSKIDHGVLTITLNRPQKKNALTNQMYFELVNLLTNARHDDCIRAVLFVASGDVFCAGNDMGDFLSVAEHGNAEQMYAWTFIQTLADFNKPIVAAVSGMGVGIGTTLLLHCDLVYVHKEAKLMTPFVNLALVPEAGSSLLLVQRIGYVRAFEMLVLGKPITGQMAYEWGLANACFDDVDEMLSVACQATQLLASKPVNALLATKKLMRHSKKILDQMDQENVEFLACLASDEAKTMFKQFLQK